MIRSSTAVSVSEASQVAEARRAVVQAAAANRLSEGVAARASLVITELATNLVKHAGGGSILIGVEDDHPSLTLTAVDKGKGIPNLRAAMQDGYSTAGSPGTGLGAVERKADHFDVYSAPGKGTVVFCRIDDGKPNVPVHTPSRIRIAGVCIAKRGEEQSGDSWGAVSNRDIVTIMVADGLGHGDDAATASLAAVRAFREAPDAATDDLIRRCHDALRATRGAALGIARIHQSVGTMEFNGVGNIAATVISEDSERKAVSHNGIVGHEMRKVGAFTYPWQASSILVMHSDGIGTAWHLNSYPGLQNHDPAVIAAVIFRDFCRGTDDAAVVVAKAT